MEISQEFHKQQQDHHLATAELGMKAIYRRGLRYIIELLGHILKNFLLRRYRPIFFGRNNFSENDLLLTGGSSHGPHIPTIRLLCRK